ncbi:MAG: hypothetical protein HYV27_09080 [Candidatus Hydrogenedentes bacterium]|nr:hypothetical protein [Candidatus Hydrogenedentota bacterium]
MTRILGQPFSRRAFLATAGALALTPSISAKEPEKETYENQARGIRILPGQWRPHYPWEHIAWISPAWPSQDYLWFDFPEAIFSSQGLLFLSHINPPFPTVFQELPAVPWEKVEHGIRFERALPNRIVFGGSLTKASETRVATELFLRNGSAEPLRDITLQTCVFLRAAKEFAAYTAENKFVHVPERGWIPFTEAKDAPEKEGLYRAGWRQSGRPVADWPLMATRSSDAERYVLVSWGEHTLSMVSNPKHPCMHADPRFPDLEPGESASIQGALIFHEGPLEEIKGTGNPG